MNRWFHYVFVVALCILTSSVSRAATIWLVVDTVDVLGAIFTALASPCCTPFLVGKGVFSAWGLFRSYVVTAASGFKELRR